MTNALFSFENRGAAQRALGRLIDAGLRREAVQLHMRELGPNEKLTAEMDEVATGGFVRNFLDMFEGIFEWGNSPHDASAYAQTIRRGGAVLSVDADAGAQRDTVDRVMQTAGCERHTDWAAEPAR